MKTNKIMTRKMGQFDVLQRTSDGMFNATALLKQWNFNSGQQKKIDHYFSNDSTKEFIKAIIEESKNDTAITASAENQVFTIKKGGDPKNQGTWVCALLFVDFAMWLNPSFKVKVLQFVYDKLIEMRHSAGDNYKKLTAAVCRFPDVNYADIAMGINWIVFNKHGKDLRQSATLKELEEVTDIENKIAFAIDMGYVNNQADIINTLRKMYNDKYRKF